MQTVEIDFGRVAQDLQLKRRQVEATIALLDEGNTVPFITRYRQEQTGGLDEEQIRAVQKRVTQLRQLAERRQTVLRSIEAQGKLTDALREAILAAPNQRKLEDLYMPFKPRKQTLATVARQRGLGPLAEAIWNADPIAVNLQEVISGVVDPEKHLNTVDDVVLGLKHILAEMISETADARDIARRIVWQGKIASSKVEGEPQAEPAEMEESTTPQTASATTESAPEANPGPTPEAPALEALPADSSAASVETDEEGEILVSFAPEVRAPKDVAAEFRNYFEYSEPVEKIPPHRILAMNRGEKLGVLKLRIEVDRPTLEAAVRERLPLAGHPHHEFIGSCVPDAIERLMLRSLEREVRSDLTDFAEDHAVSVFVKNLRNLLLQPPIHGKRILAIDPGYRTGCKFAVLDEYGNLIEHGVMFPHATKKAPKRRRPHSLGQRPQKIGMIAPDAGEGPFAEELVAEVVPTEQLASGDTASESAPASESVVPAQEVSAPPSEPASAPVLPADAVHRATPEDGGAPETGGELEAIASQLPVDDPAIPPAEQTAAIETTTTAAPTAVESPEQEVSRLWREVGPKQAVNPAWFGIVVPTPDDVDRRIARKKKGKEARTGEPKTAEPRAKSAPATAQLSRRDQVKRQIGNLCKRLGVSIVAIGNGAACRETEELVAEVLGEGKVDAEYVIVNEAGASVYSTNAVGREEFPQFDATTRGTISIGRRLQDPLSELVKIDPHSLGVGLYQHDIGARRLRESLGEVVESAVNFVGVDLNTASASLLQYVSGLNQARARSIVDHRKAHGPFKNREQIKEVNGVGPAVFTQAAGFLRIPSAEQPLDSTWIHPESYEAATKLLAHLGFAPADLAVKERLDELKTKLTEANPAEIAAALQLSEPLVFGILHDLARPGRDPREDLPPPVFKKGVIKLEDLSENMRLQGTVLNVVDFGAFVDIGLKDSGLVHISQLANRFIRSPHEVVSVGDVVTVWVLTIDRERRRVSLTMIEPGTAQPLPHQRPERRPERRPPRREPRPQGQQQPAPAGAQPQQNQQQQQRPGQQQRRPAAEGGGDRPVGRGQPQQQRGGPGAGGGQRRYGQQPQGGGHGARPAPRKNQSTSSKGLDTGRQRREPKPVKLSPEALSGKSDLRSFGELKEFFKAKKPPDKEGGKQKS